MIDNKNIPSDAPRPRLCHIVKRDDFNGYGFNLHAQKNKPGQFIGTVDENSPAEKAGLLEGDRILEVNGVNIANENHKQVVERIKAISDETSLLVVDRATDDYYRKLDIVISGDMDIVLKQSSNGPVQSEPDLQQLKIEEAEVEDQVVSHPLEVCVHEESEGNNRKLSEKSSSSSNGKLATSIESASSGSPRSTPSPKLHTHHVNEATSYRDPPRQDDDFDGLKLNLNMSAKEMREMICAKKKRDPRKDSRMDFKKKYEIIQTL